MTTKQVSHKPEQGPRSPESPLRKPIEAADYLRITTRTLQTIGGLPRIKVGGLVRYRQSDIDAYLERQTR